MTETFHLEVPSKTSNVTPWVPTPSEVAQIVEEMRPIIAAFAERSRRELSARSAPPYAA